MQGLNLSNKIEIGVDFNVVSNPTTHNVPPSDSKYIQDGEVITSFTIKKDKIVKISHRDGWGKDTINDDLDYAVENIFKFIKPSDLVELVLGMEDLEYKYLHGLKVIRLLNFYTS